MNQVLVQQPKGLVHKPPPPTACVRHFANIVAHTTKQTLGAHGFRTNEAHSKKQSSKHADHLGQKLLGCTYKSFTEPYQLKLKTILFGRTQLRRNA